MTLLAFLQYILAAIALIGLLGLVAYGLIRWVIYIIVWQPWVKVEAVTRPVRVGKVCGYHDGCPPDGPVCHLCEDLQPTRPESGTP